MIRRPFLEIVQIWQHIVQILHYFRWKIGNVNIESLLADLPSSWSCPENIGSVKSSFLSGSRLPWSRADGGPWSTANSEWIVSEMCSSNFLQTLPLVSLSICSQFMGCINLVCDNCWNVILWRKYCNLMFDGLPQQLILQHSVRENYKL